MFNYMPYDRLLDELTLLQNVFLLQCVPCACVCVFGTNVVRPLRMLKQISNVSLCIMLHKSQCFTDKPFVVLDKHHHNDSCLHYCERPNDCIFISVGGFFNVHLTSVLLDCGKIVIRRNDVNGVFLFFSLLAQTCRRHNKSESLFSFWEFVPHFISHGSQDCQHCLRVPFK